MSIHCFFQVALQGALLSTIIVEYFDQYCSILSSFSLIRAHEAKSQNCSIHFFSASKEVSKLEHFKEEPHCSKTMQKQTKKKHRVWNVRCCYRNKTKMLVSWALPLFYLRYTSNLPEAVLSKMHRLRPVMRSDPCQQKPHSLVCQSAGLVCKYHKPGQLWNKSTISSKKTDLTIFMFKELKETPEFRFRRLRNADIESFQTSTTVCFTSGDSGN